MATIAKQEIEAAVQIHGSNPFTLTLKEGASQSFVKGELVVITGGYVVEIASDTPSAIYGVAAGPAHNTTAGAAEVPVELATPEQLFRANVLQSSLADHVLAQTDLGTDMAIQRDTSLSKTFLNASTTAGANIRVFTHKQARGTSIGDTNGQVLFNFKPNWIQMLGTS